MEAEATGNGTMAREELQAAIEADRQGRVHAFKAGLDKLIQEHQVTLVPQVIVIGEKIQSTIIVQAN